MRNLRTSGLAIVILFLALPGCGDDETVLVDTATGPTESAGTIPDGTATVCTRETVEGCTMAGLRFDPPLPLSEALAVASDLGGTPIAVYRTDRVCVPDIQFSPVDEPGKVASRFAYVDADAIARRRMAAVDGGLAPPITGIHISQSYWAQWNSEWSSAQRTGVQIEGVAVWMADEAVSGVTSDPRVVEAVTLAWRWTDSVDPGYPGELLMDGRAFPGLSMPASPDC